MSIWILAAILFLLIAALGYLQGALRLAVSLFGLILGVFLAMPLGPVLAPIVSLVGVKHPAGLWAWPVISAFLIIFLVFVGVSFFVHHKVAMHFKYHSDDLARLRWERLNKRLGICLGLFAATAWLWLLGVVIYVLGYPVVQLASEDTSSMAMRAIHKAKYDLHETGLHKWVAASDPMPEKYYHVSDILGLIYQNPILLGRLTQYPPFLTFGDRPEFQDIGTDSDFTNLLLSKGDFTEILKHQRTQTILSSPEVIQHFVQLDLADLETYLETGISPKYVDEKILGRWKIDTYATLAQERKKRPDITATEMIRLKKIVTEILPSVTFLATTENKVILKVEGAEAPPPEPQADPQDEVYDPYSSAPSPSGGRPGMSPELASRYGLNPGGTRPPGQAAPRAQPRPQEPKQPSILSAEGSWSRSGSKYKVTLRDQAGNEQSIEAISDGDKLILYSPIITMMFEKAS